jgi:hypothetical protein
VACNVFLLDLLSALTLAGYLSTALLHMSDIVLIPELDLTRRSHGTFEQHLVEHHPSIAVQGLHMQVHTPTGAHEHRGRAVPHEGLDARLTKDHVALGTLEGGHWGDQLVAQGTQEVRVHVVGFG